MYFALICAWYVNEVTLRHELSSGFDVIGYKGLRHSTDTLSKDAPISIHYQLSRSHNEYRMGLFKMELQLLMGCGMISKIRQALAYRTSTAERARAQRATPPSQLKTAATSRACRQPVDGFLAFTPRRRNFGEVNLLGISLRLNEGLGYPNPF